MPLQMRYPNLVKLDGVELTDESRTPLQEERDERSIIVDLASGKKKKFVQGVRRRWTMSWENVSSDDSQTVDGYAGRDEIRSLSEGAGFVAFEITDGRNSTETYTVMIESYTEETITRRGEGGFRYKVDLTVVEQG